MQQCFSLPVCFFLDRNKNPNLDFLQQEKQKQNKIKTQNKILWKRKAWEKKKRCGGGAGCGLQVATTILDVASKPKKSTNRSVIFYLKERTRGGS